jgi:hypothetical protein
MAHLEKIAAKLTQSVKPLDDLAGAGEAVLLALVSRAASWGASIPNAVLVARSAQSIFSLSWGLSLAIAASLELIGHALVEHWQSAKSWNATKRQSDQAADAALALGLMVGYWALDFVMVGILALSTWASTGDWRIFAACLYPLIGVAVAVVTNERAHLFRVKQQAEMDRKQRAEARRQSRRAKAERADARAAATAAATATMIAENETLAQAKYIYDTNPGITGSALGRKLGLSERQGRNIKTAIETEISGNGRHLNERVDHDHQHTAAIGRESLFAARSFGPDRAVGAGRAHQGRVYQGAKAIPRRRRKSARCRGACVLC